MMLSKGTISKDKNPCKRILLEDGDFNMFSLCMNILMGNFREKRIHEDHSDQEKCVSVSPLNVELPNILFNN